MNKTIAGLLLLVTLSGSSGLSTCRKNAATGAAIGASAGAVLTGWSSFGTVGVAAIGGVIGHGVDSTGKRKWYSSHECRDFSTLLDSSISLLLHFTTTTPTGR